MHPHRDMEIITYVIEGQLEHQDQLGNRGLVHPGEVQVMSAGKGIVHSEFNPSPDQPVHLLQLWVMPRHRNNRPAGSRSSFRPTSGRQAAAGRFLRPNAGHADDRPGRDDLRLEARGGASAFRSQDAAPRHGYLFVIDGAVTLNGQPLENGDQGRIAGEDLLQITATQDAELIQLDLP